MCSCAAVQLSSCAADLGETLPLDTDLCEVDYHHGSPGNHHSLAHGQVEATEDDLFIYQASLVNKQVATEDDFTEVLVYMYVFLPLLERLFWRRVMQ